MQDLPYRQEVLLYQKFVIENKSEKERTEKRKTMSNTLQEQIEMEEEVRESIKKCIQVIRIICTEKWHWSFIRVILKKKN